MSAHSCSNSAEDTRATVIGRIHGLLPRADRQTLQAIEDALRTGFAATSGLPSTDRFRFTIQELQLVQAFRALPADERRDNVVEAVVLFVSTYA